MKDSEQDLSRHTAEIARIVHGESSVALTAEAVADLAVSLISGCDAAGVSLVRKGRVETAGASHPLVVTGDAWQYEQEEGPCLDAMTRDVTLIESPDLVTDDRWPRWAPKVVRELEVRSMLSYRLFTTNSVVGALNLYSHTPNAFSDADHDEGHVLAGQAAVALASSEKLENLQIAVGRRTTIGQAQGLLMERFGVTPDQAFDVLVRLSRSSNQKLFDLAESVVNTRRLPHEPALGDEVDKPVG